MRIKELAAAVGTPVETIRYYERTGLMPEAARAANNYRVYTKADAERLRFIRNCRALDMNLDEIHELIRFIDGAGSSKSDCSGVRQVIDAHLQHVQERIRSLHVLEKQLNRLLKVCDHPEATAQCGMVQELFSEMDALGASGSAHGVHTT